MTKLELMKKAKYSNMYSEVQGASIKIAIKELFRLTLIISIIGTLIELIGIVNIIIIALILIVIIGIIQSFKCSGTKCNLGY